MPDAFKEFIASAFKKKDMNPGGYDQILNTREKPTVPASVRVANQQASSSRFQKTSSSFTAAVTSSSTRAVTSRLKSASNGSITSGTTSGVTNGTGRGDVRNILGLLGADSNSLCATGVTFPESKTKNSSPKKARYSSPKNARKSKGSGKKNPKGTSGGSAKKKTKPSPNKPATKKQSRGSEKKEPKPSAQQQAAESLNAAQSSNVAQSSRQNPKNIAQASKALFRSKSPITLDIPTDYGDGRLVDGSGMVVGRLRARPGNNGKQLNESQWSEADSVIYEDECGERQEMCDEYDGFGMGVYVNDQGFFLTPSGRRMSLERLRNSLLSIYTPAIYGGDSAVAIMMNKALNRLNAIAVNKRAAAAMVRNSDTMDFMIHENVRGAFRDEFLEDGFPGESFVNGIPVPAEGGVARRAKKHTRQRRNMNGSDAAGLVSLMRGLTTFVDLERKGKHDRERGPGGKFVKRAHVNLNSNFHLPIHDMSAGMTYIQGMGASERYHQSYQRPSPQLQSSPPLQPKRDPRGSAEDFGADLGEDLSAEINKLRIDGIRRDSRGLGKGLWSETDTGEGFTLGFGKGHSLETGPDARIDKNGGKRAFNPTTTENEVVIAADDVQIGDSDQFGADAHHGNDTVSSDGDDYLHHNGSGVPNKEITNEREATQQLNGQPNARKRLTQSITTAAVDIVGHVQGATAADLNAATFVNPLVNSTRSLGMYPSGSVVILGEDAETNEKFEKPMSLGRNNTSGVHIESVRTEEKRLPTKSTAVGSINIESVSSSNALTKNDYDASDNHCDDILGGMPSVSAFPSVAPSPVEPGPNVKSSSAHVAANVESSKAHVSSDAAQRPNHSPLIEVEESCNDGFMESGVLEESSPDKVQQTGLIAGQALRQQENPTENVAGVNTGVSNGNTGILNHAPSRSSNNGPMASGLPPQLNCSAQLPDVGASSMSRRVDSMETGDSAECRKQRKSGEIGFPGTGYIAAKDFSSPVMEAPNMNPQDLPQSNSHSQNLTQSVGLSAPLLGRGISAPSLGGGISAPSSVNVPSSVNTPVNGLPAIGQTTAPVTRTAVIANDNSSWRNTAMGPENTGDTNGLHAKAPSIGVPKSNMPSMSSQDPGGARNPRSARPPCSPNLPTPGDVCIGSINVQRRFPKATDNKAAGSEVGSCVTTSTGVSGFSSATGVPGQGTTPVVNSAAAATNTANHPSSSSSSSSSGVPILGAFMQSGVPALNPLRRSSDPLSLQAISSSTAFSSGRNLNTCSNTDAKIPRASSEGLKIESKVDPSGEKYTNGEAGGPQRNSASPPPRRQSTSFNDSDGGNGGQRPGMGGNIEPSHARSGVGRSRKEAAATLHEAINTALPFMKGEGSSGANYPQHNIDPTDPYYMKCFLDGAVSTKGWVPVVYEGTAGSAATARIMEAGATEEEPPTRIVVGAVTKSASVARSCERDPNPNIKGSKGRKTVQFAAGSDRKARSDGEASRKSPETKRRKTDDPLSDLSGIYASDKESNVMPEFEDSPRSSLQQPKSGQASPNPFINSEDLNSNAKRATSSNAVGATNPDDNAQDVNDAEGNTLNTNDLDGNKMPAALAGGATSSSSSSSLSNVGNIPAPRIPEVKPNFVVQLDEFGEPPRRTYMQSDTGMTPPNCKNFREGDFLKQQPPTYTELARGEGLGRGKSFGSSNPGASKLAFGDDLAKPADCDAAGGGGGGSSLKKPPEYSPKTDDDLPPAYNAKRRRFAADAEDMNWIKTPAKWEKEKEPEGKDNAQEKKNGSKESLRERLQRSDSFHSVNEDHDEFGGARLQTSQDDSMEIGLVSGKELPQSTRLSVIGTHRVSQVAGLKIVELSEGLGGEDANEAGGTGGSPDNVLLAESAKRSSISAYPENAGPSNAQAPSSSGVNRAANANPLSVDANGTTGGSSSSSMANPNGGSMLNPQNDLNRSGVICESSMPSTPGKNWSAINRQKTVHEEVQEIMNNVHKNQGNAATNDGSIIGDGNRFPRESTDSLSPRNAAMVMSAYSDRSVANVSPIPNAGDVFQMGSIGSSLAAFSSAKLGKSLFSSAKPGNSFTDGLDGVIDESDISKGSKGPNQNQRHSPPSVMSIPANQRLSLGQTNGAQFIDESGSTPAFAQLSGVQSANESNSNSRKGRSKDGNTIGGGIFGSGSKPNDMDGFTGVASSSNQPTNGVGNTNQQRGGYSPAPHSNRVVYDENGKLILRARQVLNIDSASGKKDFLEGHDGDIFAVGRPSEVARAINHMDSSARRESRFQKSSFQNTSIIIERDDNGNMLHTNEGNQMGLHPTRISFPQDNGADGEVPEASIPESTNESQQMEVAEGEDNVTLNRENGGRGDGLEQDDQLDLQQQEEGQRDADGEFVVNRDNIDPKDVRRETTYSLVNPKMFPLTRDECSQLHELTNGMAHGTPTPKELVRHLGNTPAGKTRSPTELESARMIERKEALNQLRDNWPYPEQRVPGTVGFESWSRDYLRNLDPTVVSTSEVTMQLLLQASLYAVRKLEYYKPTSVPHEWFSEAMDEIHNCVEGSYTTLREATPSTCEPSSTSLRNEIELVSRNIEKTEEELSFWKKKASTSSHNPSREPVEKIAGLLNSGFEPSRNLQDETKMRLRFMESFCAQTHAEMHDFEELQSTREEEIKAYDESILGM